MIVNSLFVLLIWVYRLVSIDNFERVSNILSIMLL
jgi:hypothetical protein